MYEWNFISTYKIKQLYKSLLPNNALCFDLGSHLGNRTKVMSQLARLVISVEPQPSLYAYQKKKFKKLSNVKIEQLGIGAKKDVLTFYISEQFPTISTFAEKAWRDKMMEVGPSGISYDQEINVEVISLDLLIAKYGLPDYCKLDIEGFEIKAIEGLSEKIPLLSFEFMCFKPNETDACLEKLSILGYQEFNYFIAENANFVLPNWVGINDLKVELLKHKSKITAGEIFCR